MCVYISFALNYHTFNLNSINLLITYYIDGLFLRKCPLKENKVLFCLILLAFAVLFAGCMLIYIYMYVCVCV